MGDTEVRELGPIDYLVVEYPAGQAKFDGAALAELKTLVDAGTVKVLDLLIITKEADGSVDAFEVHEFDEDQVGLLREFGAELAELLSLEDVGHIAEALEPGTVAAALVYENTWAAPFAAAVRHSGGQLVAQGRIPMQAIIAALEADDDDDTTEGA